MKFDMTQDPGSSPSGGAEGSFDVAPPVIGSVLSAVALQPETNETMARALETAVSRVKTVKTLKEMFGHDSGATIDLAWNGREEDFSPTAMRLRASMVRVTEPTGLQWYHDTADLQSRNAAFATVPSNPEAIAGILREKQD